MATTPIPSDSTIQNFRILVNAAFVEIDNAMGGKEVAGAAATALAAANTYTDNLANAVSIALAGKSPTAGNTGLVTVGTISTGVWQGTAITDTYIASAATWNGKEPGRTAVTEAEAQAGIVTDIRSWSPLRVAQAIAALGGGLTNPMTTRGDVIVGTTAGAPARMAIDATIPQFLARHPVTGEIVRALVNYDYGARFPIAQLASVWANGDGTTPTRVASPIMGSGFYTSQLSSTSVGVTGSGLFDSVTGGLATPTEIFVSGFVSVSHLADATDDFVLRIGPRGFPGVNDDTRFGHYLRYERIDNAGKWKACIRSGSTLSTADTGVTVAANTSYFVVIAISNSGVKFYINASLVATFTTNLPARSGAQQYYLYSQIARTAGTATRNVWTSNQSLIVPY